MPCGSRARRTALRSWRLFGECGILEGFANAGVVEGNFDGGVGGDGEAEAAGGVDRSCRGLRGRNWGVRSCVYYSEEGEVFGGGRLGCFGFCVGFGGDLFGERLGIFKDGNCEAGRSSGGQSAAIFSAGEGLRL